MIDNFLEEVGKKIYSIEIVRSGLLLFPVLFFYVAVLGICRGSGYVSVFIRGQDRTGVLLEYNLFMTAVLFIFMTQGIKKINSFTIPLLPPPLS